jgi:hypothetical protein
MKTINHDTIIVNLDSFDYTELVQMKYNKDISFNEFKYNLFCKLEYLYKHGKFFVNPGLYGCNIDNENIHYNL